MKFIGLPKTYPCKYNEHASKHKRGFHWQVCYAAKNPERPYCHPSDKSSIQFLLILQSRPKTKGNYMNCCHGEKNGSLAIDKLS